MNKFNKHLALNNCDIFGLAETFMKSKHRPVNLSENHRWIVKCRTNGVNLVKLGYVLKPTLWSYMIVLLLFIYNNSTLTLQNLLMITDSTRSGKNCRWYSLVFCSFLSLICFYVRSVHCYSLFHGIILNYFFQCRYFTENRK